MTNESNNTRTTRVLVAIPTFRRPEELAVLLGSLAALKAPTESYNLRHFVFDNDEVPSARPVVEAANALHGLNVEYQHVPSPGLAAVRNATLSAGLEGADYLAMIDDDEIPSQDWLVELLKVQSISDSDVVVGPIISTYPATTPMWIVKGGFFGWIMTEEKNNVELSGGQSGQTSNCLLKMEIVRALNLRFNSAFNFTGGEDTLFFREIASNGGLVVYAHHASVTEAVPPQRATLKYILSRAFRRGNTNAICDLMLTPSAVVAMRRTVKALGLILRALLLLPSRLITRGARLGYALTLRDTYRGLGMLAGLIGYRMVEYPRTSSSNEIRNPH